MSIRKLESFSKAELIEIIKRNSDSIRLTWIEENITSVQVVNYLGGKEWVLQSFELEAKGNTLREAIHNAMIKTLS